MGGLAAVRRPQPVVARGLAGSASYVNREERRRSGEEEGLGIPGGPRRGCAAVPC